MTESACLVGSGDHRPARSLGSGSTSVGAGIDVRDRREHGGGGRVEDVVAGLSSRRSSPARSSVARTTIRAAKERSSVTRRVRQKIAKTATRPTSTASLFWATSHSPRLVIRSTLTTMLATAIEGRRSSRPPSHAGRSRVARGDCRPSSAPSRPVATISATKKRSKSELKGRLTFEVDRVDRQQEDRREEAGDQPGQRPPRARPGVAWLQLRPSGARRLHLSTFARARRPGAKMSSPSGGRYGRPLGRSSPVILRLQVAPAARDRLGRDQQHAPADQHDDEDERRDLRVDAAR